MNKTTLNYIIDVLLGISFLLVFTTGILKWKGWTEIFEGIIGTKLNILAIIFVHDWSGLAMGILVLIHLILHWNWIKCMTLNFLRRNNKQNKCD